MTTINPVRNIELFFNHDEDLYTTITAYLHEGYTKKAITELIVDFGIFGEYTPDKKTKYTKLEVFKALKDFNID
tara:strand:- start:154 stop:375 length:222 start_codon:yes stop_codon:yes gene_type:complete